MDFTRFNKEQNNSIKSNEHYKKDFKMIMHVKQVKKFGISLIAGVSNNQ
jgi:hypothetical protein